MYVLRVKPGKIKVLDKREFNEFVMKLMPSELRGLKDMIVSYPK